MDLNGPNPEHGGGDMPMKEFLLAIPVGLVLSAMVMGVIVGPLYLFELLTTR